jgi:hypothetical protein
MKTDILGCGVAAPRICPHGRSCRARRSNAIPLALVVAALVAIDMAPVPAAADDHFNLEEGLPVTTEDAYPIVYRGAEFQSVFTYERSRDTDKHDLFSLEPRFAYGLFPRFQITPRVSYALGTADGRDSGTAGIDGVYQLNDETPIVPIFSLSGSFNHPYGFEHSANETVLKLIVAKNIDPEKEGEDIHINLAWTHNYNPTDEERADRYEFGIAYAHPIGEAITLVVDYVREQDLERNKTANLIEAGMRYRVSDELALAAGAGVGIGRDSPSFRFTMGLQRALDWFSGPK